jgi:competence protein ComEC
MEEESLLWWARRHVRFVCVVLVLFIDIFLVVAIVTQRHSTLRVSFLDVGQGDAILIDAPSGNQILYDAGPPSGAVLRSLSHVLPFWDHTIDVLVSSHPDQDHIGGFPDILRHYDAGVMLESGATAENGTYDALEHEISTRHVSRILAHKGMQVVLGDGVVADVLFPDHDMAGSETNAASIVLRVRYGTTAFLLSGDLPQEEEEYVAREFGDGLHAEVLKLGHHGSRTSSAPYWLAAVAPDEAIISAGANNRYGHPHKEVLELLNKLKIPYLETAKEGTITFESDGETITRVN